MYIHTFVIENIFVIYNLFIFVYLAICYSMYSFKNTGRHESHSSFKSVNASIN